MAPNSKLLPKHLFPPLGKKGLIAGEIWIKTGFFPPFRRILGRGGEEHLKEWRFAKQILTLALGWASEHVWWETTVT